MGFQVKPLPLARQQRVLWQKRNDYIQQEGGWIVSQPDTNPIKFECPMDSELPTLLIEAGHPVRSIGTHKRCGIPVTETVTLNGTSNKVSRQQSGIGIVGVHELSLPSDKPPVPFSKDA